MKSFKYIILLVILASSISCQKEEEEIYDDSQNPAPANLIVGTPLVNLLARTSQSPTSIDNVLDNSSCFSVQLPVAVTVNSQNILVTNQWGYQSVQNAKDASTTDDDIVYFTYPITIKFQNFTTKVINSLSELNNEINNCDDDDSFDEIDCITINYPISINIYNTDNQVANTLVMQNNSQFFNFIDNLSPSVIAAIAYPISVTDSNGNNLVISSNSQLEVFIDDSIDDCNAGSGGSSPSFSSILTSGTWRITYFYDNGDETSNFTGYNFTFNANWTSIAIKNATSINGTWTTYLDSGNTKLDLSFDGDTLSEIEDDWRVTEYSATEIRLKDVSGGNGGTDYLYFTKN